LPQEIFVKPVALCVFGPGGAIGAGALLQQLLVSLWPAAQAYTISKVSLDSYFAVVALAALSSWVAVIIKRSTPSRGVMIASFIFPAIWFVLMQFAVFPIGAPINALRIVFQLIAAAPIISMALVYALPSSNRQSTP
jgi:hypothetical protein